MKKTLTVIILLGIVMSSAFADTIRVLKPLPITNKGYFVECKNMKFRFNCTSISKLKDNEYFFDYGAIIYRVYGKCYRTTQYEIEYED